MIQEIVIPLISLIALEIILGIDNLIFISILSGNLPPEKSSKLRFIGIGLMFFNYDRRSTFGRRPAP